MELSKTPDEIKKGLECYAKKEFCAGRSCAYYNALCDCDSLLSDAFSYIQQLEAQNAELLEKIKQLERERDAAIHDLKKTRECTTCEYVKKSPSELPCVSCGIILKNYEWRGPCEENGGN